MKSKPLQFESIGDHGHVAEVKGTLVCFECFSEGTKKSLAAGDCSKSHAVELRKQRLEARLNVQFVYEPQPVPEGSERKPRMGWVVVANQPAKPPGSSLSDFNDGRLEVKLPEKQPYFSR